MQYPPWDLVNLARLGILVALGVRPYPLVLPDLDLPVIIQKGSLS